MKVLVWLGAVLLIFVQNGAATRIIPGGDALDKDDGPNERKLTRGIINGEDIGSLDFDEHARIMKKKKGKKKGREGGNNGTAEEGGKNKKSKGTGGSATTSDPTLSPPPSLVVGRQGFPTARPVSVASDPPTSSPVVVASGPPTSSPVAVATNPPTKLPTSSPVVVTPAPTDSPTTSPVVVTPAPAPTDSPTTSPVVVTSAPTDLPSTSPVAATPAPTDLPSTSPVSVTSAPTDVPTDVRTKVPSGSPSEPPSESPSETPSVSPTADECSTPLSSDLTITLVNMGTNTDYDADFAFAASRWESIIINDLPGYSSTGMPTGIIDWFYGFFSPGSYSGAIEDIVIGYSMDAIDGPGGILGSAGPAYTIGSIPVSGVMKFDSADFVIMSNDDARIIILHEMGHVLGLVGTLGSCVADDCKTANNFAYSCPRANAEYEALATGNTLLMENDGGDGTKCGHWDEESFDDPNSSELMTGFFEAGKYQPISRVTIAALEDIGGYHVDYCVADGFPMMPSSLIASRSLRGSHYSSEVLRATTTFRLKDRIVDIEPIDLDLYKL